MIGTLPPVGTPIRFLDVIGSVPVPGAWKRDRPMESAFCELSGRRFALAVGSGRMAVALLLEVLSEGDARDRVVIPGYTCFTVAASIARTEKKIEPANVDPATLDFDYERLEDRDWSRVLAVIPSSLLGFPADLPRLEAICKKHGVHLIDDAAQCLGATIAGRAAGSFGIAGVYSLGRGKNLSAMGGGVIVTDDEQLDEKLRKLIQAAHVTSSVEMAFKTTAYSLFLRPVFYGAATAMPGVDVGSSKFDPRFPFTQPSGFQRKLARRLMKELPAIQKARVEAGEHYRELLAGHGGIAMTEPHEGAQPVYLRFPIRVVPRARGRIYRMLTKMGLGASAMYPEPVSRIPGISAHLSEDAGDLPQANTLARSLLTLPTHPYVSARHRERIAEVLRNNLRERE